MGVSPQQRGANKRVKVIDKLALPPCRTYTAVYQLVPIHTISGRTVGQWRLIPGQVGSALTVTSPVHIKESTPPQADTGCLMWSVVWCGVLLLPKQSGLQRRCREVARKDHGSSMAFAGWPGGSKELDRGSSPHQIQGK